MANRIVWTTQPLQLSRGFERSRAQAQLLAWAYELAVPVGRPTRAATPRRGRGGGAASVPPRPACAAQG